jgi:hypothetical protein
MNGPTGFGSWFRYWGDLAEEIRGRFSTAADDVRGRSYSTEKVISDVLGLWMDGTNAWWSMLWGTLPTSTPVVLFEVKLGKHKTEAKPRSTSAFVPGVRDPDVTDLARLGGKGTIRNEHVKLELGSGPARQLFIRLVGVTEIPGLEAGQYMGLVHLEERPIAVIHVLVHD